MSLLWPILRQAVIHRHKIAVTDDHRQYTYAQILGGAMFLAEHLDRLTAARHVGLMLPTSGAFPMALLGCWLAERVAVPLNYLLVRDELAYVAADSDIDTILTARPMIEFLGGLDFFPPHIRVVLIEDLDFTGIPPLRWPPIVRDDQLAVLIYTSGTSGKPKGVMLSHGNLDANVRAGITHSGLTDATRFLGVLPQFHSFGLTALTLIPLCLGSHIVYTARFIPKKIVSLIREHQPMCILAVPSMYGALLTVKEAGPADFASIQFAVSGGEALPNALLEEFERRFGVHLLEGYGLTETSPALNWSTPQHHRLHAVGKALPGVEILIVDEANQPLPPLADGEILAAGPNIMQGYYKLPQVTAQVFADIFVLDGEEDATTHDGPAACMPCGSWRRYFRTGDIGHVDSEGYLFITGRKKEMFKVAGEMVTPREIEEVLNLHPAVAASAVISKSDGMRGEVPVAFLELREEARDTFKEQDLRLWCRDRLAPFKVPRDMRVMDALPRNPTGKILRRALKAE